MFALTREEMKTVMHIAFSDFDDSEAEISSFSGWIQGLPDETKKSLMCIACQDRNILLTLIALTLYTIVESFRLGVSPQARLDSILEAATHVGKIYPDLLKEICGRDVNIRLPDILLCFEKLDKDMQSMIITEEPAGNC